MKRNHFKSALNRVLLGIAIVGTGLGINACTDDQVDELNVQFTNVTTQASVAPEGNNGDIIPGQYIVVLKADEANKRINRGGQYNEVAQQARALGHSILKENGLPEAAIGHAYGNTIAGFSAALNANEVARLRADKRVAYVEPDRIVTIEQKNSKSGGGSTTPNSQDTPWGITKVGGAVNYSGTAVAWVIDTGIDLTHPDLNINSSDPRHYSVFTTGKDASPDDANGHGTHVAGTIAARNNTIGVVGVAAGATVIAVKVLDARGSGSVSGVISGVDYVRANARNGDVANMSLGVLKSQALNDAVIAASGSALTKNVYFTVAAGNDGKDANLYSPASAAGTNIYTVSAYDANYFAPSWSNFGVAPVDYTCPGVSINSTWKGGGYNTISGTSMAAPHLAGIILVLGNTTILTNGYLRNDSVPTKYGPVAVHSLNTLNIRL